MLPPWAHGATAAAMLVGGCTIAPPETPAEALARRQLDCQVAGFTAGDSDFRLCLLLQQANERLAAVERRLTWIEQQVGFGGVPVVPGRRWW